MRRNRAVGDKKVNITLVGLALLAAAILIVLLFINYLTDSGNANPDQSRG
jgi:hypothetical protein